MGKKYREQSAVDATFHAYWAQTNRSPKGIQWALTQTKKQLGAGMPPKYVPPPLRKLPALESKLSTMDKLNKEAAGVQKYRPAGLKMVQADIDSFAVKRFSGFPKDVARELMWAECIADPKARDAKIKAIIKKHWKKIDAYRRRDVMTNAPARNIDEEYRRRAAERDAIDALSKTSIVFSGPKGRALAAKIVRSPDAMMMLDMQFLTQNTLASGFYGLARYMGADHGSAMEIGKSCQNALEVAGAFGGGTSRGVKTPVRRPTTHAPGGPIRPKLPAWTQSVKRGKYFHESGIPRTQFKVISDAAKAENKIVILRMNKAASIKLLENGAPSKGMDLSKAGIKCSSQTGVATAKNSAQIQSARKLGYAVVDADGIARDAAGKPIKFSGKPFWKIEPGQVIETKL